MPDDVVHGLGDVARAAPDGVVFGSEQSGQLVLERAFVERLVFEADAEAVDGGGVVAPGQKLMDIVPGNEALLLEVQVAPHLIDRVHADLPVDVRFNSFAHSPQLVVAGQVVSVSGDLLTDPHSGISYYLARVQLTPEGVQGLGKRRMQPGMPVEVVFKTGERSMLTYLPSMAIFWKGETNNC